MHKFLEGTDGSKGRQGKALHWQPSQVQLMSLVSNSTREEVLLHAQQHAGGQGLGTYLDTMQSGLCVHSGKTQQGLL